MRETNLLVRWAGQKDWHIVPSRNHGATECNTSIPLNEEAPEYAEAGRIENVNGICSRCFHRICIEDQDPAMWSVYYEYVAKKP